MAKAPESAAAARSLSAVEISFSFIPPVNPSPPLGAPFIPPRGAELGETEAPAAIVPPIEPPPPELPSAEAPPIEENGAAAFEAGVPVVEPVTALPPPIEADSLSVQAILSESKAVPRKESKADADRLYAEGQKLFAARDYQAAANKFKEALLFREKQLAARLSLGVSLLRLGKPDAALEHFKVAEAQNREYPPTIYNFASYYATVGDVEQAVRELKRAFALYPKLKSWPATDPDFDRIRDDERFRALFQR